MATITNAKLKHYKMVEKAYHEMLNTSYFIEQEKVKRELRSRLFNANCLFFVVLVYAIYITFR